ncbi:head-tail adaptor protein [Cereibacter sp. SYSU M97828]|nr:head-tail adaptor protein [Cereibacter flavus]
MTLDRALVLEASERVGDGAGGFRTEWTALGTLWADVKPGTGRELAGVEVTGPQVSYRITVRAAAVGAPSRPKAGQRFRDGVRLFQILAVTEGESRFLTCFAREGMA